jgi:hypothetical protein
MRQWNWFTPSYAGDTSKLMDKGAPCFFFSHYANWNNLDYRACCDHVFHQSVACGGQLAWR